MKKIGTKWLALLISIVMFICSIQEIHAEESAYSHCETATSGSVTMKVEWNDPVLGQPTTFHVSATGGSGAYKFRMDAPSYTNPNEMAYESVADPSRGEWMNYTNECNSTDYSFTMTASGTYNFRFYLMDKAAGVYYLRVSTYIQVSDSNHPSVRSIVQSAVAQCNNETDGSDYQKALWLHDWLLNQLEYDNTLKWSSAESALTRGLGTCQAYESAYSMLLSTAGIENTETRDTYDGHTWNAMKLDGEWYQVDCTWDDSSDNWYNFDQRRLYFGLTDELMAVAHPGYSNIYTVSGYGTRSTTLKNNYFVKSGKAQKWVELYRDRIQNRLNSKQTQFSIQADNSTYPPSIFKIQNGIIAYVMNQNEWFMNGKKVVLDATVNDNKFDFTVTYPKECTKHDWNEFEVTTEPTCTKDGIKTYTCKNCATTKTEIIKALGHDYSSEWTVDKEATCTEEGSKSHHCTRCDDKKDVTIIPKIEHNWNSGVVTTKATCMKDGIKTYTCKDCKTTKTEVIKALGHDYSSDWTIDKAATCTEEGSKSHHCTRCDDKKDVARIEKLNHSWKLTSTIESTKDKEGKNIYTCNLCNEKREEVVPKLIGKWVTNNNGKWFGYSDGTYENTGFKKINESTYYFQNNGYVKTGWLLDNSVWYYFNKDGIMQTGWSGPGRQYYFDDAGKMLEKQFTPDGYYVESSGAYVRNGWVLNNGNYYYMNGSGKMVKRSWVGSYYLGSDGVMVMNKWIGDYWCGSDGAYVKSKWIQWNGNYYYLDSDGIYLKNKWKGSYYLGSNGAMVTNCWIGNYWCGSDGKYVKSAWVDNNRYYVNEKGIYVAGTWKKDDIGRYYQAGDVYAKDITLNINGIAYEFDSRGYWITN